MNVINDTLTVARRAARLSLRNPTWVIIGLVQPILYLTFFGPLLEPIAASFGAENAFQFFVPGLLVQLGIFGSLFAGFGLIAELQAGVIESQRVTPASRVSLLAGRVLWDVAVLLVQGIVLVLVAIPFGLRAPVGGVLLGLVVVALLGACFASASYALGLRLKTIDSMASVSNAVALPLLLLSGILLPMTLAPTWLRRISDVNPIRHVVDGARDFFLGNIGSSTSLWGLVIVIGLVSLGVWFGTRTFQRQSA